MKNDKPTYLMGDVHANLENLSILHKIEPGSLFILGDVGFGFSKNSDKKLIDFFIDLVNKGWEINLIRGNHDNPSYWYNDKYGIKGINFLKDYTIVDINDKKYLVIGGGVSIDVAFRTPNINWWEDEEITIGNRNVYKENIYGILSHTGFTPPTIRPMNFDREVEERLEREMMILNFIKREVKPKKWYYGHYHVSSVYDQEGCRCRVLDEGELLLIN